MSWRKINKTGRQGKAGEQGLKKNESRKLQQELAGGKKGIKDYGVGQKEMSRGKELKNYEVIKYALITEKAVNMIEAENKLVFIVDDNAGKQDVKKAVEELYKVKVDGVNVVRDRKGRKKAIIKINEKFKASDIATRLGVI